MTHLSKPPLVKGATQRVGDFALTNATSYFHEKPGCIGPGERYLSPYLLKEETVIRTAGSTLLMAVFSQITGNQGGQVKLSIELNEPPLSRLHRDISPLNGGEEASTCWYKLIDTSPYPVLNMKAINPLEMPRIPGYQHVTMFQNTGGNNNITIWKYHVSRFQVRFNHSESFHDIEI